jgi:hypothetical protein
MADELEERYLKPKVGSLYRGQAWVELHGTFTADELLILAHEIETKCRGLNDDHKRGHQH